MFCLEPQPQVSVFFPTLKLVKQYITGRNKNAKDKQYNRNFIKNNMEARGFQFLER